MTCQFSTIADRDPDEDIDVHEEDDDWELIVMHCHAFAATSPTRSTTVNHQEDLEAQQRTSNVVCRRYAGATNRIRRSI